MLPTTRSTASVGTIHKEKRYFIGTRTVRCCIIVEWCAPREKTVLDNYIIMNEVYEWGQTGNKHNIKKLSYSSESNSNIIVFYPNLNCNPTFLSLEQQSVRKPFNYSLNALIMRHVRSSTRKRGLISLRHTPCIYIYTPVRSACIITCRPISGTKRKIGWLSIHTSVPT